MSFTRLAVFAALLLPSAHAMAGAQIYEPMAASVRSGLQAAIADKPAPRHGFSSSIQAVNWLTEMSHRLEIRIPHFKTRLDFLRTVHYEATRAGLDPQLVLAIIQIESNFRKYAVSSAGARGYMQVMPFWTGLIGRKEDRIFSLRTNLRYGCTILKHYIDIEKGNVNRALGRYNGSLGKSEYPNLVFSALQRRWQFEPRSAATVPLQFHPRASLGSPLGEASPAWLKTGFDRPALAQSTSVGKLQGDRPLDG
ncbi:MAG: lytic transglycosylase domain-containing protein [Betaproteobacteria bacterium]|nr:lytic transglycosylase domain-containing protein [Betaproteobacteria bacterium]